MHVLIRFDHTERRRACASSETIDLRTLKFGLVSARCPSTTSERVTDLHITVPAITRGTLARPHELNWLSAVGFWEVFWILGCLLNSGKCIWILGCVFGFWEVFWVLGSVLEPMSHCRIFAPHGDTKRRDTRLQHEKRNFVFPSGHVMFYLLYIHQRNTKPLLFNNILLRKVWFIT